MDTSTKKELLNGFKRFRVNLYDKFKTHLREKRLYKEEKTLRLKMAILSGGIKKVK